MDNLKNKMASLGKKNSESGEEPVSGKSGQGTASEPYDASNQQDQPQPAGTASQSTGPTVEKTVPYGSVPKGIPPVRSSGHPTKATDNNKSGDAESAPKIVKEPTSEGPFQNTDPFSNDSTTSGAPAEQSVDPKAPSSGQEQASAGADMNDGGRSEARPNYLSRPPGFDQTFEDPNAITPAPASSTNSPVSPGFENIIVEPAEIPRDPAFSSDNPALPNHLGHNVPPGQFTPPRDKGKGKAKMTDADYESSSAASNRSSRTRTESVGTDNTITSGNTYSTAGTGASTLGSRRPSNVQGPGIYSQGQALTAGGLGLGEPARIERERQAALKKSIAQGSLPSIDDVTSPNTKSKPSIRFKGAPTATTTADSTAAPTDAGPSLHQHQDDVATPASPPASSPTAVESAARPPANSPPATDTPARPPASAPPANSPPDNTTMSRALPGQRQDSTANPLASPEAKGGRRRSVKERAKDALEKLSERIKPSSPSSK